MASIKGIITNIKITDLRGKDFGKLVGYASVEINECLVIRGFKIMEKNGNELWVANPSKKTADGYQDQVFVTDADARKELADAIINAFTSEAKAQAEDTGFSQEADESGFAQVDGDDDIPF